MNKKKAALLDYGTGEIPQAYVKSKMPLRTRRGVAIHAYVGPNGGGKSLAMVNDTLTTLNGIRWKCENPNHLHTKLGQTTGYRKVLSTVRLIDPRDGSDHPLWIPYDDHRRLLSAEHTDILMDEVTGVASSTDTAAMPTQVTNMLMQLRRRDCFLRWTTPNWLRAARVIREVTKAVTYCKGSFAVYEPGRSWASNLVFTWKTYDAENFESFNVNTRNRTVPQTFQWYWRKAAHNVAMDFYDTQAEVMGTGGSDDRGYCVHCGGMRTATKCMCERHEVDSEENLTAIGAQFATNPFFERELIQLGKPISLAEAAKQFDAPVEEDVKTVVSAAFVRENSTPLLIGRCTYTPPIPSEV